MKQKFALLTIVGALLALAVPAVSSAAIYPASSNFEIAGTTPTTYPALSTSLGTCYLKITGQTPKAPENETASGITITPSVTSCASGLSTTLTAEKWVLGLGGPAGFTWGPYGGPADAVVIRSTTLPGCKLTSTGSSTLFQGMVLNGTTTPKVTQSLYHAHGVERSFTWANDGGACAIAGKKEAVVWGASIGVSNLKNLTTPATPIIVTS